MVNPLAGCSILDGGTIEMHAEAEGDPAPHFEWTRDGYPGDNDCALMHPQLLTLTHSLSSQ
jgi:hypothetical protein